MKDIYIVDNFYQNAQKIREIALKTEYIDFGVEQNFPGKESVKSFYSPDIIRTFEKIVGHTIEVNPQKNIFGKFRCSLESDNAPTSVHLDYSVQWTGVVYLSLDEHIKGSLGIYKFKELDMSEAPSESQLVKYNCNNIREFDSRYIYPNSKNFDAWETLNDIPIKFNRLILFKGSKYFHSIQDQFGDSIENGRLTQNFFFNVKRDN
ncbi:DUF6445 family protein [Viridibacillus arvi]|uniref:DUF6445 family protein n=1 Tax=Viridibacillus arvi TaxID=263475 RepID=UPI003D076BE9